VFDKTYVQREQIREVLAYSDINFRERFSHLFKGIESVNDLLPMDRAFYLALKTTLAVYPRDQIVMADSNGVCLEYPFLDRNIVEYTFGIPSDLKLKGFDAKHIFKQIARKYLPAEILNRKKYGLPVPLVSWLRDEQGLGRYLDLFISKSYPQRSFYNYTNIRKLIADFKSGQDNISEILWVLINLELWIQIMIERKSTKD
jgi:asparagine synthase (glutamine-hydrolysing)